MSWQRVDERGEAELGKRYRTTYFVGGPFPNVTLQGYMEAAIAEGAKASGKMVVHDVWFIDPGHAATIYGADRPYNTYAVRVEWTKRTPGTPLLFFMGPAGILTLSIVAAIVVIIGAVIVARLVEAETDKLGEGFGALFSPGTVIAAMVIVALIYGGTRK